MSELDRKINSVIETLEESDRLFVSYKETYLNTLKQKEEKFLELAEKVKPIIDFMKSKNYAFNSTKFDCFSKEGPVIGYKDNIMFVYAGGQYIIKQNVYNPEEHKPYLFQHFFSEHSFTDAIEGLLSVITFHEKAIKQFQDLIDEAERELESI